MDTLELTDQDPLELLYESVRAQRRLLTGYGGHDLVPRKNISKLKTQSMLPSP